VRAFSHDHEGKGVALEGEAYAPATLARAHLVISSHLALIMGDSLLGQSFPILLEVRDDLERRPQCGIEWEWIHAGPLRASGRGCT